MPAVVFLIVFVTIFFLVVIVRPTRRGGLGGGRVLARGLVLSASSYASGERTVNGQRFELRDLVLDVEIPGREPYEVSVTPLIPRICEGLPGAAFDLSVHPSRPSDVTIIGPAGSAAWLPAATQLNLPSLAASGMPTRIVWGIFLGMFGAAFASSFVVSRHDAPAKAPAAHVVPASCLAATRCCAVIGGTSCSQFATMESAACSKALQAEQAAAAKAKKRCQ